MEFASHTVSLPMDEFPCSVSYNRNLLQKAGVPLPPTDWSDKSWTWDQFFRVGKSLTQTSGGAVTQWGIGNAGLSGARFSAMLLGGDWFPDESYTGGWITQFTGDQPAVAQAYQYRADLTFKYHVSPTPAEQTANA